MRNKDNVFSFDLNESLHFEKGQEVSEMVSISLEPEISIQSFQDYISIRGVIELEGEYVKKDDNDESIDTNEKDGIHFIEKVMDQENGYTNFSHRFPVEISVPAYRIHHVDDISVHIETFDYELPTEDQLILTSTIEILGVHHEEITDQPASSQQQGELLEQTPKIEGESFEFELKPRNFDKSLKNINEKVEEEQVDHEVEEQEESENITEESTKESHSRWKQKQTQSLEEFMQTNDEEKTDHLIPVGEEIQDVKDLSIVDEQDEQFEEIEENNGEEVEGSSEEPLTINYLDDLFTEKESEEKYTKMRICIVQEKDTLETISERYEIPKLQLLKQNRLEDDQLSEGQLLSIPVKSE